MKLEMSYRQLPPIFYTDTTPTKVRAPKMFIFNDALAQTMGMDATHLQQEAGVALLAGQSPMDSLAQAYAGHQFGYFNMLGDGRAVLLGEWLTPQGERVDVQLKGAGRTFYSRGGDGRAALGPMLREYIISEAMYALGIPTTRSLAVVTTGEEIVRESLLPGAILTRIASSHIRVGTFQFAARFGSVDDVRALADYTIARHFSAEMAGIDGAEKYAAFLQQVIRRQAHLIAKWQLVGFIHGVMNTDNMSICGETIDYGPCAFMDTYNLDTVFSSIDSQGRYAYGNQPYIATWNLARLAESLLPLLADDEEQAIAIAERALDQFADDYHQAWLTGMRGKLGILTANEDDDELSKQLLTLMRQSGADYTNTFRALTLGEPLPDALSEWYERWQARLREQGLSDQDVQACMRAHNPAIIPRNDYVEEALQAAQQGDDTLLHRLLAVLANPFAYTAEQAEYAQRYVPNDRPYRTYCGT